MHKNIVKILLIILSIIFIIYLFYVLVIPKVINSQWFQRKIAAEVFKKTGYSLKLENFDFKTKFNLKHSANADLIVILDNDKTIFSAKNTNLELGGFRYKIKKIKADYFFFDKSNFKQNSKNNFKFEKIPQIEVKKTQIYLENDKNNFSKIELRDIFTKKHKNEIILNFFAKISSNRLNNDITADKNNKIIIKDKQILSEDFKIFFNNNPIILSGIFYGAKGYDFKITGKNIAIKDISDTFLFYRKQKEKKKNFIENFYDFKGLADVDLKIKKNDASGEIVFKNFHTKSKKLNIPFNFQKAVFYFDKNEIKLKEFGTFGGKRLFCELKIENLFSAQRITKGVLSSNIDDNFARKYLKNTKIKGEIGLSTEYFIQNKKPEVNYEIKAQKGTNIFYKNSQLGFSDKNRKLRAKTLKNGADLLIREYNYFIETKNIIKGNGNFKRINDKLKLEYVYVEAKDYVPVFLIGSFGKFIKEGYFRGYGRYNAFKKQATGKIELKKSKYKDLNISYGTVFADEKIMDINFSGDYEGEFYRCFVEFENNFKNKIVINDINFYLKKYEIKKGQNNQKHNQKQSKNKNQKPIFVKKGKISLDKLIFKHIFLENLTIFITAKNNIIDFSSSDINFANGILKAKGIYDVSRHSSDIIFSAEKIDSNLASGLIFNLKDQFEGKADAKMHLITKNKLQEIEANANFSIKNGKLTKLGSEKILTDFKKDSKNKLKSQIQKIIDSKTKELQALSSNIDGSFKMHNKKIDRIEIYNKNKFISLYLEGNYEISSQSANLCLWGKYNKNILKGIKIFFIPINWIVKVFFKNENSREICKQKINKIPQVEAKSHELEIFRAIISGNINIPKTLKIDLKSIK